MGVEDVFLSAVDMVWHHELSDQFVDHGIYPCRSDVLSDMIGER